MKSFCTRKPIGCDRQERLGQINLKKCENHINALKIRKSLVIDLSLFDSNSKGRSLDTKNIAFKPKQSVWDRISPPYKIKVTSSSEKNMHLHVKLTRP